MNHLLTSFLPILLLTTKYTKWAKAFRSSTSFKTNQLIIQSSNYIKRLLDWTQNIRNNLVVSKSNQWFSLPILSKLQRMNLLYGADPSSVMCLNNSAKTPYRFTDCACILFLTTKFWTFFSIRSKSYLFLLPPPFPSFS